MKFKFITVAVVLTFALIGCGKRDFSKMSFNNGTYTGESPAEKSQAKATVTLKIENNKIVACTAKFKDWNGEDVDSTYGKGMGAEKYKVAQQAYFGMTQYPQLLLKNQDPADVDAVTGSTVSHKEFILAVWNALDKAKK